MKKSKNEEYNDDLYYGIDNQIKITKDSDNWAAKLQIKKQLQLNSQSCPKEEKVLYSEHGRKIKVLNNRVNVKGYFILPKTVVLTTDREQQKTDLNPHMFSKTLFINREARMARKYLCTNCPINNCNYKLKKGR